MKRIKNWWNKKTKKERKTIVFRTLLAIAIAILLMAFGSAVNFTLSGYLFSNLPILVIGIIIGYFLCKYLNDNEEEEKKEDKKTKK